MNHQNYTEMIEMMSEFQNDYDEVFNPKEKTIQ